MTTGTAADLTKQTQMNSEWSGGHRLHPWLVCSHNLSPQVPTFSLQKCKSGGPGGFCNDLQKLDDDFMKFVALAGFASCGFPLAGLGIINGSQNRSSRNQSLQSSTPQPLI